MRLLPMLLFRATLLWAPLIWAPSCLAQANVGDTTPALPDAPQPSAEATFLTQEIAAARTQAAAATQATGSVTGEVTDPSGALVPGAALILVVDGVPGEHAAQSGSMGEFSLHGIPAGSFHVRVTAEGLLPGEAAGKLLPGQTLELAPIVLRLSSQDTQVDVTFTREELGVAEVQAEEKQRLLGIIPNFSVAYDWNAPPMTTRQKYDVAWKLSVDPVTILLNGGLAGYQGAVHDFPGYHYGAAGYFKRFGADMATGTIGTFLSGALLPQIFHQDPRYFWKGSGSFSSRLLYALSTVVICRSDRDGHWMTNYSNIVGDMTAGAISNLYYPSTNRTGVTLTIENGAEALALGGISSVLQEFVLHRFTPKLPPSTPAPANGLAPPPNLPPAAAKPAPDPATPPALAEQP